MKTDWSKYEFTMRQDAVNFTVMYAVLMAIFFFIWHFIEPEETFKSLAAQWLAATSLLSLYAIINRIFERKL